MTDTGTGKYIVYFSGKITEADRPEAWTVIYPDGTKQLTPSVEILGISIRTAYREPGMPTTGVLLIDERDVSGVLEGATGGLIFWCKHE